MNTKSILAAGAILSSFAASALPGPQGLHFFNNHLTVKPYVSLEYTYDSNFDTTKHASSDSIFLVRPGANFDWKGERWNLTGDIFGTYHHYARYNNSMKSASFGERVNFDWTTSDVDQRGWSLVLGERYTYISQNDSLTGDDGRGIWRDRENVGVSGALEYRFTGRWHADVSGQYTWIDYKNDTGKYAPLYGWSSYTAGLGAGYMFTKWTDLLLSGSYSSHHHNRSPGRARSDDHSESYTIHGGLGSRATERIRYRALVGMSWLDYGGNDNVDRTWTYSLNANWMLTRRLSWSLMGSSHYRPSERSYGRETQLFMLSTGLSWLTLADRMNLHANIAYHHEEIVYTDSYAGSFPDYDEDLVSIRIGANYYFNRWISVFANFTWQEEWSGKSEYDYSRYRGTVGLRLHY